MDRVFVMIEQGHVLIAWCVLAVAFLALARCADIFVESSVALAERFQIPKFVIGILLVSFATTAPELSVSVMAAIHGNPEMALGNAIGSVICNSGLALALCGLVSTAAIPVIPRVLRSSGGFLALVCLLAYGFVFRDHTLSRGEGCILVSLFLGYMVYLLDQHRRGLLKDDMHLEELEDDVGFPLHKLAFLFLAGLLGIIVASKFTILSATRIAIAVGIPNSVIAMTLVAFGTSVPEVATSIMAARKGEGELAIGNILGANIMNICWVAGASSIINTLVLSPRETSFMFPAMLIIVVATLFVLRSHHSLSRKEGALLLGLYLIYLGSFFVVFR